MKREETKLGGNDGMRWEDITSQEKQYCKIEHLVKD